MKARFFYCLLFFAIFIFKEAFALDNGVVFNEIAWMGTDVSSNDEWIELYNQGDQDIDLTGWQILARDGSPAINLSGVIVAGGYFLLERTDDDTVQGITADFIYSGALGNGGEYLELKNNDGVVDAIDALSGWLSGDNTSKETMARASGGVWQNSSEAGGTPRAKNFLDDAVEEILQNNNEKNPVVVENYQVKKGDVVINEFVSDPEDGDEWIEIFNNTKAPVILNNWYVQDGSGAKTFLLGEVGSFNFFIIEKPKGSLNNSGDAIFLYSNDNILIDKVIYGNWNDDDQDSEFNAPVARKKQSVGRFPDGTDSVNNANDFFIFDEITKGASNHKKEIEESASNELNEQQNSNGEKLDGIAINEILPSPYYAMENEFIEIYNSSDTPVDLGGWLIKNLFGTEYVLQSQIIGAYNFLVLYRAQTKIILNNKNDTVFLCKPDGGKCIKQNFKNALDGQSLNWDEKYKEYFWHKIITPGVPNIALNKPPKIIIYSHQSASVGANVLFNASDTVDPENGALNFVWDFGDGLTSKLKSPAHIFLKSGDYVVRVFVDDGINFLNHEIKIKIMDDVEVAKNANQENIKIQKEKNIIKSVAQDLKVKNIKSEKNNFEDEILIQNYSRADLTDGMEVILEGAVIVSPGVFGSQIFYLKTVSGTFEIYSSKKDFGNVAEGDYIQARGEISLSERAIPRLKIKKSADIAVIDQAEIIPIKFLSNELSVEFVGEIVVLEGEIAERKGSQVYLLDEAGEFLAVIKNGTGISVQELKEGDVIGIVGMVWQGMNGMEIWPRSIKDINNQTIEQMNMPGDFLTNDFAIEARAPINSKKIILVAFIIFNFLALTIWEVYASGLWSKYRLWQEIRAIKKRQKNYE